MNMPRLPATADNVKWNLNRLRDSIWEWDLRVIVEDLRLLIELQEERIAILEGRQRV